MRALTTVEQVGDGNGEASCLIIAVVMMVEAATWLKTLRPLRRELGASLHTLRAASMQLGCSEAVINWLIV